jgi:seryl-tRNA synthetase
MLDPALVRAEPARVRAALARRGTPATAVDAVVALDGQWADRREVCEALRLRRRRISEEFARLQERGNDTAELETLGRAVGDELTAVEQDMADLEARRIQALLALPNLPASDVPNAIRAPGVSPGLSPATDDAAPAWPHAFAPLAHTDLMELLRLAAPDVSPGPGRGWLVWRGRGARLVRALTDFMLAVHTREFGCEEVRVPAVTTRAALTGSAHLPLLGDKMYALAGTAGVGETPTSLYLAPRAEPCLANLYADQVLDAAALPIRLVAAGPAFRREAAPTGAAGKGLLRLHQFDTVELYTLAAPESAEEELARAVRAAETILDRLEVPHRRRLRAAPDLSHAAAKTVDLEVWAPGLGQWLAVAAISSFTDYQARRTGTRVRDAAGHTRPVHTVGGAAVALPHVIAAILENHQQADASVRWPEALRPFIDDTTAMEIAP